MNGHIANAVAVVCAGNQFVAGKDISGFWPDASVFNFMKLVEFRHPPASGVDTDEYPLVAADPMEWFGTLKGMRGLRLHNVKPERGPHQQLDVPDRMLAAFVGGGQRWLIEVAGEEESELWEAFHRVGDRNDRERRIWMCTHILQGTAPRLELDADALKLDEAVMRFREALVAIEIFASEAMHDNFADIFRDSIAAIDAGKPTIDQGEMSRFTGFDDRHAALFEACSRAWVFGGMGSWNDLGESGERYDRVSQDLYESLNDCIAALATSTYRG
jgi:hypothetical protein